MITASRQSDVESHSKRVTTTEFGSSETPGNHVTPSASCVKQPLSGRNWSALSILGQTLVVLERQPQSTAAVVATALDVGTTTAEDALRSLTEMRMAIALHVGPEVRYVVNDAVTAEAELVPGCTVGQMLELFSRR